MKQWTVKKKTVFIPPVITLTAQKNPLNDDLITLTCNPPSLYRFFPNAPFKRVIFEGNGFMAQGDIYGRNFFDPDDYFTCDDTSSAWIYNPVCYQPRIFTKGLMEIQPQNFIVLADPTKKKYVYHPSSYTYDFKTNSFFTLEKNLNKQKIDLPVDKTIAFKFLTSNTPTATPMINLINETTYYTTMTSKEFEMIAGTVAMFLKNATAIKHIEWLPETEYSCGNDPTTGEDAYIIILSDPNECSLEEQEVICNINRIQILKNPTNTTTSDHHCKSKFATCFYMNNNLPVVDRKILLIPETLPVPYTPVILKTDTTTTTTNTSCTFNLYNTLLAFISIDGVVFDFDFTNQQQLVENQNFCAQGIHPCSTNDNNITTFGEQVSVHVPMRLFNTIDAREKTWRCNTG